VSVQNTLFFGDQLPQLADVFQFLKQFITTAQFGSEKIASFSQLQRRGESTAFDGVQALAYQGCHIGEFIARFKNLANFESVWRQVFCFRDLANFGRFF